MSAPVIPPGKTWLDTLQKSFVDVPVDAANDDAVATKDFLDAAESFTTLLVGAYSNYTAIHTNS